MEFKLESIWLITEKLCLVIEWRTIAIIITTTTATTITAAAIAVRARLFTAKVRVVKVIIIRVIVDFNYHFPRWPKEIYLFNISISRWIFCDP